MKYIFTVLCLAASLNLYGDSAQDEYETIRDNAEDCHEEHELGERDYPNIVMEYKSCRDAPLMAIDLQKTFPEDLLSRKSLPIR